MGCNQIIYQLVKTRQIWMSQAMFNASCRYRGSLINQEHPCRIDHHAPPKAPPMSPQKTPHLCQKGGKSERSISIPSIILVCRFVWMFFWKPFDCFQHFFVNELWETPNSSPILTPIFVSRQKAQYSVWSPKKSYKNLWKSKSALTCSKEAVFIQAFQVCWSSHQPIPSRYHLWDTSEMASSTKKLPRSEKLGSWRKKVPITVVAECDVSEKMKSSYKWSNRNTVH